jgi:hypothetical protein
MGRTVTRPRRTSRGGWAGVVWAVGWAGVLSRRGRRRWLARAIGRSERGDQDEGDEEEARAEDGKPEGGRGLVGRQLLFLGLVVLMGAVRVCGCAGVVVLGAHAREARDRMVRRSRGCSVKAWARRAARRGSGGAGGGVAARDEGPMLAGRRCVVDHAPRGVQRARGWVKTRYVICLSARPTLVGETRGPRRDSSDVKEVPSAEAPTRALGHEAPVVETRSPRGFRCL